MNVAILHVQLAALSNKYLKKGTYILLQSLCVCELSGIAVAVDCLDDHLIMCVLSCVGCSNPINLLVSSLN